MSFSPETRESLILRLPTLSDAAAWQEFVQIYEPLVLRFARRRGLQDADARELVQNVLVAVARAVADWQPDRQRGRFRAWLFRIARNQLINLVSRRRPDRGSGRSADWQLLQLLQAPDGDAELLLEYRRELFRSAAMSVRSDFRETTWEAFWRSSVLQQTVDSVAADLGISVGAVYIARSRVLQRLKEVVLQWESADEE